MDTIGLIAGKSDFPLLFAKAAKSKGVKVIAVGIEGETKPEIGRLVDKFYWVKLGELSKVLEVFKSEGIKRAVMAGGITKSRIFNEALKIDGLMKSILVKALDKKDDTLLSMITSTLKSAGVELLDSTLFLEDLLPDEGALTKARPEPAQEEDIKFGAKIAREVAGLDIGLSIFVKDKAVIAVEDIEGTDAMIRRGGRLAGPGGVVIKVARPKQNMKF
ncbi:MAG: UDP-2,3-diacylglucosamine diphosphatase LpxI, partial [Candidatus Omnitrophota bacterium]|nr:UDP-2,3-diacylglucosamine diphosphatase LpxI [Candidatus Omnitrophota bacterium]